MAVETIIAVGTYASIAASLAGAVMSVDSSNKAAKQTQLNAQAQADAIAQEKNQKALEFQENQRRAVVRDKRERAQQLAAQASTGALLGTGSELAVLADTLETQHVQRNDEAYQEQMRQRELAYQASSGLQMADSKAANLKMQGYGSALSGLASAAGSAGSLYGGYKPKASRP